MGRRTVKNKPRRMRSQTKKLGLGSKKPIKKKSLKKKPLKKKPSKKTKKGVGLFNRFRKKINPQYKLRNIVFRWNEDNSEIGAYYIKPPHLEREDALKKFRFNVNQLEINKDRIVIKEAYEEEGTKFLKKFENFKIFSIHKYSTIPLGPRKFSLKFWGINETVHQDIIDFFQPKKEKFNEVKQGKSSGQPIPASIMNDFGPQTQPMEGNNYYNASYQLSSMY